MAHPRNPLDDISFDNIDVNCFNDLMKEQAALQIVPAQVAQQARLFQPAPSAAITTVPVTDITVVYAKHIIQMLANQAKLLSGKSDCELLSNSSTAQRQLYYDTHSLKVDVSPAVAADIGQQKSFNDVCKLIEATLFKSESAFTTGYFADIIELSCLYDGSKFTMRAAHRSEYLRRAGMPEKLAAPVTKIPFDSALQNLDNLLVSRPGMRP